MLNPYKKPQKLSELIKAIPTVRYRFEVDINTYFKIISLMIYIVNDIIICAG